MSEQIRTVLAIGALILAVLLPLALAVAIVGHGVILAHEHGAPIVYDIPDARVYWANQGVAEAGDELARLGQEQATIGRQPRVTDPPGLRG